MFRKVKQFLKLQSLFELGPLIEAEALEMHSVMLSQTPSLNYFLPQTTAAISWLRKTRIHSGIQAYFTLDAGPNLHIISSSDDQAKLVSKLKDQKEFSFQKIILDQAGQGAQICKQSEWTERFPG